MWGAVNGPSNRMGRALQYTKQWAAGMGFGLLSPHPSSRAQGISPVIFLRVRRAACSLPIASPPSVTNSVVAIDVFQKPAQESASLVRFAPGRAPEQAISQDNRRVCALLVCLPISARNSRVVFVV